MNKELLEFLKSRRSIRAFKGEQIAADALDAVLDAGVYAPTGMGKQSPVVVAVQDRETREQLVRMNAQVMGASGDPYYGAPTILLVFGPKSVETYLKDACNVLTYLLLAAHAAGLGAVWIDREREMFETEEGRELLRKWGLPDGLTGVGAVALGYADGEAPRPAARKKDYVVKFV
ncbi:MAG: nitroreductase family protein [Clostridiales Family XIII bacterium]|jgi:nitroreductase|nr:nitroreductase family protein [Clostridiales Family XIII bacterium]